MSVFAIVATHFLKSGSRPAWVELAMKNAVAARKEPGCLQFDVVMPREQPDIGILIERYVDEAAWHWHFRQPYCRDFMDSISDILFDRTRVLCDVA